MAVSTMGKPPPNSYPSPELNIWLTTARRSRPTRRRGHPHPTRSTELSDLPITIILVSRFHLFGSARARRDVGTPGPRSPLRGGGATLFGSLVRVLLTLLLFRNTTGLFTWDAATASDSSKKFASVSRVASFKLLCATRRRSSVLPTPRGSSRHSDSLRAALLPAAATQKKTAPVQH